MRKLEIKYNVLQYAKWLLLFMYVLSILGITSALTETSELLIQKEADYAQLQEAYEQLKTKYEPDTLSNADLNQLESDGVTKSQKAQKRQEKITTYFWAILLGLTAAFIFLFSFIEKKMNKILIKSKDDENLNMN